MLLAILFCILKNNARGYPATVTAVDIIDTMYVFIDLFISALSVLTVGLSIILPAVLVSQLFRDEMELKKKNIV